MNFFTAINDVRRYIWLFALVLACLSPQIHAQDKADAKTPAAAEAFIDNVLGNGLTSLHISEVEGSWNTEGFIPSRSVTGACVTTLTISQTKYKGSYTINWKMYLDAHPEGNNGPNVDNSNWPYITLLAPVAVPADHIYYQRIVLDAGSGEMAARLTAALKYYGESCSQLRGGSF